MERVIVLFVALILTAIVGGGVGRALNRPDIADLIGNTAVGIMGAIAAVIAVCYCFATWKTRRLTDSIGKDPDGKGGKQ